MFDCDGPAVIIEGVDKCFCCSDILHKAGCHIGEGVSNKRPTISPSSFCDEGPSPRSSPSPSPDTPVPVVTLNAL